ncbi:P-loop containing nucleoside triphosphate hydrolase protein [Trichoderma velutinum]
MYELVDIVCKFSSPWVLQRFLIERDVPSVVGIFLLSSVNAFAVTQASYRVKTAGLELRAGLVSYIYDKILASPNQDPSSASVVNLVEVDVVRIQDFATFVHAIWSAPLQLTLATVSLGLILGWQSTLAAALSVVAVTPLYYFCKHRIEKYQIAAMIRRDARMSLTSEALSNASLVKLWAQEPLMEKRLDAARCAELAVSESIVWVSTLLNMLMRGAPTLISVVAFMTAVFVGNPLRSEHIFPSLVFCSLLVYPLALLPIAVSSWAACASSYSRVKAFCAQQGAEETPSPVRGPGGDQTLPEGVAIYFNNVSFRWKEATNAPSLLKVSFLVGEKQLAALVGPVSAGKSTIVKLALGSLKPLSGLVDTRGTIAYAPQDPWLITGSIRENILFGRDLEPAFYEAVIRACALDRDLERMPHGDDTQIRSHGTGLSGGQKSRIALARAVYARADVYVLDDPLAAVDSQVHRHLVDHVIGPQGILKDKTRLVVTSSEVVCSYADQVLQVTDGQLQDIKTSRPQLLRKLPERVPRINKPDFSVEVASVNISASSTDGEANSQSDLIQETQILENSSTETNRESSLGDSGRVSFTDYTRWLRIAHIWRWSLMAFFTGLAFASNIMSTYMLKVFADKLGNGLVMRALEVYAAAGVVQTFMSCLSLLLGWYLCLKPTSHKIHGMLVAGVLQAPLSFLQRTPTGEIMNRFANDLARHDGPLFTCIFGFLNSLLRVVASLVTLLTFAPSSAVAVVALGGLGWWLQRRCLGVLVETRRLETSSRSPLITNLQETMAGSDIIRIFGRQSYFETRNFTSLRRNLTAYMAFVSVELWLILRLSLICSLLQGLAAAFLLVGGVDASATGFVMSYMLQLATSFTQTVILRTQMECDMVSTQRIFSLIDTKTEKESPSEGEALARSLRVIASWPSRGTVTFRDFSASYNYNYHDNDNDSSFILRNINLDFAPGQSTAIVGRTGAGKSSLALAMLRVLQPTRGRIEIDGIDITQVELDVLRSRVAIIPQNCGAFAGTVRTNLDPNGVHSESDLLRVVGDSLFARGFKTLQAALDYPVLQGGSNLSAGQLQLLAVARCLLVGSNIVILDEVTSAMDEANQRLIHEALKTQLRNKTVITISHHLRSAIDNDRIIVMDSGAVAEIGSPKQLFQNGGIFKSMVAAAGLESEFRSA